MFRRQVHASKLSMIPAAPAKQVHVANPVEIRLEAAAAGRPKDTGEEASLEPSVHASLEPGNGCWESKNMLLVN